MVRPQPARRWAAGVLALAGAGLLAGCGVPTGGAPRVIGRNQLPYGLLSPASVTVPTTAPVQNDVPVNVFLIDSSDAPASVGREVPFPAVLEKVLDALMAGPTQGETLRGYTTAIPPGTRVLSASVHDGVATVDLSAPFGQIVGVAQVQAVEQVVFTVAADTTVSTGVLFEVDGQPTQVPIGTGQQVSGPVYAWAYLPRHTTTTVAGGGAATGGTTGAPGAAGTTANASTGPAGGT